jgi:hypothetical protein
MESHLDLTDQEFEQQFENGTLEKKFFSHEAHLRLAWIHLKKYGIDHAIKNIREQLVKFVEIVGAQDKYNETVTIAAIHAVHHFILRSDALDFKSFISENSRLKFQFKELLATHYRTDIFASELAKKKYLEPELLPFD